VPSEATLLWNTTLCENSDSQLMCGDVFAFPLYHSIKARPQGHVIVNWIRDGPPSRIPCCVQLN
jgi:hypothetical protein